MLPGDKLWALRSYDDGSGSEAGDDAGEGGTTAAGPSADSASQDGNGGMDIEVRSCLCVRQR